MNIGFKLRFVVCSLLIFLISMFPFNVSHASPICGIKNSAAPALGPGSTEAFYASVEGSAFNLGLAILAAMDKGYVNESDFEKLDFRSGDIEHGWNPKYRTEHHDKECFITGPNMDPALKSQIRAAKSDSWKFWKGVDDPLINLRREENDRLGTIDTLYLIVPGVNEDNCKIWYPSSDKSHSGTPLVIASDNHRLIKDEKDFLYPFLKGCIRSQDGKVYLFLKIVSKYKKPGEEQWRMMR